MFGIGGVELVVAGAVVVAAILVLRFARPGQWVRVDEVHHVAVEPTALEIPLARLLSDLPSTELHAGGPATWTLSVRRAQPWTLVPAVLLFRLGLLFLLFREHAAVLAVLRSAPGGSEVHLLGTTRVAVRTTLQRALAELPAAAATRPDATTTS
ncbi:hypothetical protein EXE57_02915 [Nocardioides euryhalodurans]|uniref:Uncharacterized protein n=2 Tax=Nocardioides euryhalodurans TaxID=2518370 RepID=A0A4P7GHL5_9ACTN|nr:hypothetical protein EXE57_02915 [Nocardioides euryhalodurans]